jgi:hypothetical protein
LRFVHRLSGQRVDAVIGERRGHDGEIAAGHLEGALAEIEVEHFVRIALDHAGVEHQIGDRAIAVTGGEFRLEHRLVDLELPAGQAGEQREHVGDALLLRLAAHQLGDGDGAGIDHRVERPVGRLVEHDGIKRFAGGGYADMVQHGGAAVMLEGVAVHERLRHRLDGEGVVGVADRVDLAVDGGDRDAEQRGIGLAEFRNVVRRLAAGDVRDPGVQIGQIVLNRSERGLELGASQASCAGQLVHHPSPRLNRKLAAGQL